MYNINVYITIQKVMSPSFTELFLLTLHAEQNEGTRKKYFLHSWTYQRRWRSATTLWITKKIQFFFLSITFCTILCSSSPSTVSMLHVTTFWHTHVSLVENYVTYVNNTLTFYLINLNTGIRIAISSLFYEIFLCRTCIAQLETETQNRKYLHILLTAFDCSCLEEYHFMVRIELIFICYTLHFKYCVLLTNIKIKEASVELVG